MNNFNINRFTTILKWNIVEGRYRYLKYFGIAVLIAFIVELFFLSIEGTISDPAYVALAEERVASMVGSTAILAVFVGSAWMMHNIKTQMNKVNCIMSPATQLEKFIARLFLVVVGSFIIYAGAAFVADGIRLMLQSQLFENNYGCLIPKICDKWIHLITPHFETIEKTTSHIVRNANESAGYRMGLKAALSFGTSLTNNAFEIYLRDQLMTIYTISAFLVAGICSRKWPIFSGLLLVAVAFGVLLISPLTGHAQRFFFYISSIALIIANFWMAYRAYCNSEIVNNWFVNPFEKKN